MRRLWLLLPLAIGCIDFEAGRFWRCDGPADCRGGWYCAGDGVCRPPDEGRALACRSDEQCARGWACAVTQLCQPAPVVRLATLDSTRTTLSPQLALERAVASPFTFGPRPGTSLTRLFLVPKDTSRLVEQVSVTLDFSRFDDGIGVELVRSGHTRRPPSDTSLAAGSTLFSISNTRPERCGWPTDGGAPACLPGGGLLRVGVGPVGDPALLLADGQSLSRAGFGPVNLGPVIDVAGVALRTECTAGLEAVATLSSGAVVLVLGDGGTPAMSTAPPARRLRAALGPGQRPSVLVEYAEDAGASIGVYELCGATPRPVDRTEACPSNGVLVDFALRPDGVVERLCDSAGTQAISPGRTVEAAPWRVDTTAAGVHLAWREEGALRLGATVATALELLLEREPDRLFELRRAGARYLFATSGGLTYLHRPGFGMALSAVDQGGDFTLAAPVTGADELQLYTNGVVFDAEEDRLAFYPSEFGPWRTVAGAWSFDRGQSIIAFLGDSVFTGQRDGLDPGVLAPRERPAPGFELTSATLAPATDGGIAEGYAVANGRLFALRVRSASLVTSVPVALGDLQAVSATRLGETFVAGLSNGQLVALPSLVPLTPAGLDGVDQLVVWCDAPVAVTGGEAWLFQEGAWAPLPTSLEVVARAYVSDDRLVLADFDGRIEQFEATRCGGAR
ncbi:MAG: hypothetical protein JNJ54_35970 [Myxococcaceae bacterium]|nr:hypothetical protein [Myxococcaceae bacterium]